MKYKHWTTASLAEKAEVDTSYIRHLIAQQKISAWKLGHIWVIDHEEGKKWLSIREQKTKQHKQLAQRQLASIAS